MPLDVAAPAAVSAPLVAVAVVVLVVVALPVAAVGVAVTSTDDCVGAVTSLCGGDLVPVSDA